MVLHDVAQRSHRVVELAAVLDPEVLGHGDVDLGDALAVPQLRQAVVGEAQVLQFFDGLFAQKVVHAQDLVFVEHRAQPGVEVARRFQVVAERLLDRHPRPLQQVGLRQVLHDGREQRRRHLEVVERMRVRIDLLGELLVEIGIGDVAVQVGDPAGQPVEHRAVKLLAGFLDGVARPVQQLLGGDVVAGHADDRVV